MKILATADLVLQGSIAPFCHRPDTQVISREGWHQVITPSIPAGGLNEVVISHVQPGDEQRIFDATFAQYKKHGVQFRWTTGYWTEPTGFADFLASQKGEKAPLKIWEAHGMQITVPALHGISEKFEGVNKNLFEISNSSDPTKLELSNGIEILEIDAAAAAANPKLLRFYGEAFARAWESEIPGAAPGVLDGEIEPMAESAAYEFRVNPNGAFFYVAMHAGRAVGLAAVILRPKLRVGYFTMAAVAREFRGLGLYRSLIDVRLARLAKENYDLGITWARAETSAPVLKKLGWQVAFTSKSFHFKTC